MIDFNEKNVREKFNNLYYLLAESNRYIYTNIGTKNIKVNGKQYYDYILLLMFSEALGDPILLIGDPGSGKTTLAELVSLFYGMPINAMQDLGKKQGTPDATLEDIVGRPRYPNLDSMNWDPFIKMPIKFVDEINRYPPQQQANLLSIAEGREVHYLEYVTRPITFAFIAAENYEDSGNTALIPPLRDRFALSVEVPSLRPFESMMIIKNPLKQNISELVNYEISEEIKNILNKEPEEILTEVDNALEPFRSHLSKILGKEIAFTFSEAKELRKEIEKIEFSEEATVFTLVLLSELDLRLKSIDHYKGSEYAFNYIDKGASEKSEDLLSNRAKEFLGKYAKMLAWFVGDKKVYPEHVAAIAPYVLAHRTEFNDKALSLIEKEGIGGFTNLKESLALVRTIVDRYNVGPELFIQLYKSGLSISEYPPERIDEKLEELKNVISGLSVIKDHPFVHELIDVINRSKEI